MKYPISLKTIALISILTIPFLCFAQSTKYFFTIQHTNINGTDVQFQRFKRDKKAEFIKENGMVGLSIDNVESSLTEMRSKVSDNKMLLDRDITNARMFINGLKNQYPNFDASIYKSELDTYISISEGIKEGKSKIVILAPINENEVCQKNIRVLLDSSNASLKRQEYTNAERLAEMAVERCHQCPTLNTDSLSICSEAKQLFLKTNKIAKANFQKKIDAFNKADSLKIQERVKYYNKVNTRQYHRGSKGGCYYISENGKKIYVDRSICN